jgi:hypothetical protein
VHNFDFGRKSEVLEDASVRAKSADEVSSQSSMFWMFNGLQPTFISLAFGGELLFVQAKLKPIRISDDEFKN